MFFAILAKIMRLANQIYTGQIVSFTIRSDVFFLGANFKDFK